MIAANDLRIGNWINYNSEFYKINSITERYCEIKNTNGKMRIVSVSHLHGILLTEEILLKCGCKKHKQIDKCYIITNDIVISFADIKIRVICGNFICQVVVTEIKYLHEFQNTIYALTKTELIINL